MCSVRLAPASMLIGVTAVVRYGLPAAPLTLNAAGLPVLPSIAQVTGVATLPPGRARSEERRVGKAGRVLETVTVNPIAVPADTLAASAALVTWIDEQSTVSAAEAWSLPSLLVVTLAVLS